MCMDDKDLLNSKISEKAVFIIGAGHFGSRASRIICQRPESVVYILDMDNKQLSQLKGVPAKKITEDGIQFLVKNFDKLHPGDTIIPAIPLHLAFGWLQGYLGNNKKVKQILIPKGIEDFLPNTWPSRDGSLVTSYADFMCPDDCPEPEICTVSGEQRSRPMHEHLKNISVSDFNVHVIRSRQIAPGVGGYTVAELKETLNRLRKKENEKWLLGTACKCHGIVTALKITERPGH
jgi:hypothetical protein